MVRYAAETRIAPHEARLGLFGGTFDPVHAGHLAIAQQALHEGALHRVLIIPAPQPPHKRATSASFTHRAAMLEQALASCSQCQGIELSLIELSLPRPSYTIQTVEAVRQQLGNQRYSLIIGMDSFHDLPHWLRAAELLKLVDLLVFNRDGATPETINHILRLLPTPFRFNPNLQLWQGPLGNTLRLFTTFNHPISSTAIRQALNQGQAPPELPASVFAYIKKHGLYGWRPLAA